LILQQPRNPLEREANPKKLVIAQIMQGSWVISIKMQRQAHEKHPVALHLTLDI